ncbi:MAG TPA: hypothetical protein VHU21_15185 [Paraburkholderia sp.]|jgi:hypothetical protein|nr:hypothetical protein [Paraburkholderia sp.]
MPDFLSPFWNVLSASASHVRVHVLKRTRQAAGPDALSRDHCTNAERLEHIAVYARAGYFNLGYTVDAFHSPVETPPQ